MARFDAYSATTQAANPYQLAALFDAREHGFAEVEGRGFHQFGHRLAFKDDTGTEVGSVLWGGSHGERTMIEVKGEHTPRVVERLRSLFPHRTTRVDSCVDFDAPDAWKRLLRAHMAVKRKHAIYAQKKGDWTMPEKGLTYHMGADKSAVQSRLYQKGRQPEYRHLARDNWVRAEVQVRPAKEAKETFSHLSPLDVWGASRWTRDLAAVVLAQHVDPHPAGTTYRLTSRDRALFHMAKQYGPHLLSLHDDLGSWEAVGLTLREMITEARQ